MFEHAQVTPSNTNIIADQEARVIPDGLTLPPPALLWEWLSYIYQTTGEWWRPPTVNNPARPAPKPESAPIVSVKEFQNYSRSLHSTAFPAKTAKTPSIKAAYGRTGFDYQASLYYKEAGRLLEQTTLFNRAPGNYAECRLVLACIIAWSRFSLFEGLPVEGASWMALSFSKAACELKMRASTFKSCLETLEAAGLLKLGNLSEGLLSFPTLAELQRRRASLSGAAATLFNAHFFQKNTALYLLKVAPDLSLPGFNPFTERLAGPGKTSETVSDSETGLESLSRSFQKAACNYESNNENDEISFFEAGTEVITNKVGGSEAAFSAQNKLELLLESLSNQQLSIYTFITQEASFGGYCRLEDRRETLDDWEALKFAGSDRYTLEQVKARYNQVKEVWESKEKCHNPLALLHWTLTNDVDPRRSKIKAPKPASNSKAVFSQPAAKQPSSSQASKVRPQLSFQKRMFPHHEPALGNASGEVLPTLESPKIFEPAVEVKEPEKLWKIIFEDLTGRFQLSPAKLALLEDATLRFRADAASQVEVVLRSIWEERQLDGSTRHLIKLALRQRIGPGFEVTFLSI